jgi:hypothetical protein
MQQKDRQMPCPKKAVHLRGVDLLPGEDSMPVLAFVRRIAIANMIALGGGFVAHNNLVGVFPKGMGSH